MSTLPKQSYNKWYRNYNLLYYCSDLDAGDVRRITHCNNIRENT